MKRIQRIIDVRSAVQHKADLDIVTAWRDHSRSDIGREEVREVGVSGAVVGVVVLPARAHWLLRCRDLSLALALVDDLLGRRRGAHYDRPRWLVVSLAVTAQE